MAQGTLHSDATYLNHYETDIQRDRVASDDPASSSAADDRQVRDYRRLGGPPRFSPSKTLVVAIVLLTVAMALITAFMR